MLTTPGGKKGSGNRGIEFYGELWFIVLMAVLGLILLAIFLSLILQRKIHQEPFVRERPPLVPVQKRTSPLSVYPPGETHMVCLKAARFPAPNRKARLLRGTCSRGLVIRGWVVVVSG